MGVAIRSDIGTFKSFNEVIMDLNSKWATLSQTQKSDAANAMAGVRQRENFLVLMNHMSMATELQTKETNSAGSAMIRYGEYAKSTEARLNDLTNTIQKFWMKSLSSDTINSIIAATGSLINMFASLSNTIGILPTLLGIGATGIFLFSKSFRDLSFSILQTIGLKGDLIIATAEGTEIELANMEAVNASNLAVENKIRSYVILLATLSALNAGEISATTAMEIMASAEIAEGIAAEGAAVETGIFATALNAIPGMAIITAISVGIGLLLNWGLNAAFASKKTDDFTNSIQAFNGSQSGIKDLQSLSDQYDALNYKVGKSAEEESKLVEIKNNIGKACKDLGVAYDAEGNAIINNSAQIQEYINLKKDQLELDREKITLTYDDTNDKNISNIDKTEKKIADLKEHLDLFKNLSSSDLVSLNGAQDISDTIDKIEKLQNSLLKYKTAQDQTNLALLNSKTAFTDLDATIKNGIIASFDELYSKNKKIDFNKFITKIDIDTVKSYQDALNIFKTDGNVDNLKKSFDILQKSLIDTAGKFGANKIEATNMANTFLRLQDPIAYAKVAILSFNSAINILANSNHLATKDIVSAFAIMGISINKTVAGILSSYMGLILGIKSVADAHNAIATIASDITEGGKTSGMGGTSSKIKTVSIPINAIGQAYEDLKNIQINSGTPNLMGVPKDTSSSSSAQSPELYDSKFYSDAIADNTNKISALDDAKSKLIKTSQDYRDTLNQETTILKQNQTFAHTEADRLRVLQAQKLAQINQTAGKDYFSLNDSQRQSTFDSLYNSKDNSKQKDLNTYLKDYDALSKSINDAQKSYEDWQKTIEANNFELVTSKLEQFDKQISINKDDLSIYRSQFDLLIPGTDEYNAKLEQIINTTKDYEQELKNKQILIEQELKDDQLTIEKKSQLEDQLREVTKAQIESQNETETTYKSIVASQKKAVDNQQKEQDRAFKITKDNSDLRIQGYQDRITALEKTKDYLTPEEKTAQLSSIITSVDYEVAQNNAASTTLQTFKDQAIALQSISNLSADTVSNLQTQLNIQLLQNKLNNEINNKNTQIMRKQTDGTWQYEYIADPDVIESTNKELLSAQDSYAKTLKDQSIKSETDRLNDLIKSEQAKIAAQQKSYDEQKYNNEMLFNDLNESTLIGLKALNEVYGTECNTILETVKSYMSQVETALNASVPSAVSGNVATSSTKATTSANGLQVVSVQANGKAVSGLSAGTVVETAGGSYMITKVNADGTYKSTKVPKGTYETGGETEATGMHWLDGTSGKPERVLSAEQTSAFNKLVDYLPNLLSKINLTENIISGIKLPNLSGITNKTEATSNTYHFDKLVLPNVTNSNEIEKAFKNLSGYALQVART
jgi:hypothetical protein